jgi:hypothetical protein
MDFTIMLTTYVVYDFGARRDTPLSTLDRGVATA